LSISADAEENSAMDLMSLDALDLFGGLSPARRRRADRRTALSIKKKAGPKDQRYDDCQDHFIDYAPHLSGSLQPPRSAAERESPGEQEDIPRDHRR
jgi:hypothetical protein